MAKSEISKKPFQYNLKHYENGILLNIHHTETVGNEIRRIPFGWYGFNNTTEFLAAIDSRGNVFIFDLVSMRFWSFDNIVIHCSCIAFDPLITSNILIGTKNGLIVTIDSTTGKIVDRFQAFTHRIRGILFVTSYFNIIVCYTGTEALVYCRVDGELYSYQFFSALSIRSPLSNLQIKEIFSTKSLSIVILLNDDSIYIWQNEAKTSELCSSKIIKMFELNKHIYPIERRDKFREQMHIQDENNNQEIVKDFTKGTISAINFSNDGHKMVVSSTDFLLMIMNTINWEVIEVMHTDNCYIKCLTEMSSHFAGEILNCSFDGVWSAVTNENRLVLFEKRQNDCIKIGKWIRSFDGVISQNISKNGTLSLISTKDGQLILQRSGYLLRESLRHRELIDPMNVICSNYKKSMQQFDQRLSTFLPTQRLLTILKEYGEYPAKYRQIIWKTLLQLPNNSNAFTDLLKKGMHQCTQDYNKIYPLRDQSTFNCLKKITSCLVHWSRVLGATFKSHEEFLPTFIFPFVKIMPDNSLLVFELLATILLNQCQLWFEFSPMDPINYLGLIENILGYFEPSLIEFYRRKSVTSKIYAWQLARTAFTEVFDEMQWLQLWDHIISGPSYFMLFAIVAYNTVQIGIIERLPTASAIELFFDEPNTIDMNSFLKKTYWLMSQCPKQLHPKQYMTEFEPLNKHQYQKIVNYPRELFDRQTTCMDKMEIEKKLLNKKYNELEKFEMNLMERLTNNLHRDEHRRRLKDVQWVYEETLLKELERVEGQRQHLILYERQIHDREMALYLAKKENQQINAISQRQNQLRSAKIKSKRNKICDETNLLAAEETLRKREMDLMANRLTQSKEEKKAIADRYTKSLKHLNKEKAQINSAIQMTQHNQPEPIGERTKTVSISIETLEKATSKLEEAIDNIICQNKNT